MSQANEPNPEKMRTEYDIRGGTRGKYLESYREGTNVVLLEPDVAAVFRDSKSVNKTLRAIIDAVKANSAVRD